MSQSIKKVTIRFHMDNAEEQRAWEHLQNMDHNRFKSYACAAATAINDYFDRQERLKTDSFLESREKEDAFLKRIEETIDRCLRSANPLTALLRKLSSQETTLNTGTESTEGPESIEMEEAALDFLDSL